MRWKEKRELDVSGLRSSIFVRIGGYAKRVLK